MGKLAQIQERIDKCNDWCGCNDKCTKKEQKDCYLLEEHRHRMRWCERKKIPIELW